MEIGNVCYMVTLMNEIPRSDNVLFVFCDFEATKDKISDWAILHVPNLVCVQQFCTQ